MRPRILCVLLLILAFLCVLNRPVVAQEAQTPAPTATTAPTPTPSPTVIPTTTPTPTNSVEVAVLKAQLETMQVYEDRLVNAVYWSLAAIGAIAAALVAYNVYSSVHVFDRAKNELRNELEQSFAVQIERLSVEAEQRVTQQVSDQDSKNEERILQTLQLIYRLEYERTLEQRNYVGAFRHLSRVLEIGKKLPGKRGCDSVLTQLCTALSEIQAQEVAQEFDSRVLLELYDNLEAAYKDKPAEVARARHLMHQMFPSVNSKRMFL